jgi:hypothetical protein
MREAISRSFHLLIHMQKPPPNPTHSTTRRQPFYPNPFHHIIGVEYVMFVGYKQSFFPPGYCPRKAMILK